MEVTFQILVVLEVSQACAKEGTSAYDHHLP